ncbi:MAG: hypothetical protein H6714_10210 [Myxococcales bacterium]|nr:hypothetical protein [Myxococcales bacterium]
MASQAPRVVYATYFLSIFPIGSKYDVDVMHIPSDTMSVEQILRSLRRKRIPIPYEIGTYIALKICEQMQDKNVPVALADVTIDAEGKVKIHRSSIATRATSAVGAIQSVLDVLSELLLAAAPGVPESLIVLVETHGEPPSQSLPELRDVLLSQLVPLNRQASERTLGRLFREAACDDADDSDVSDAYIGEPPRESDVDALLDSLPPEGLPHAVASAADLAMSASIASARDADATPVVALTLEDESGLAMPRLTISKHYRLWFWIFAVIGTAGVAFGTIVLLR